MNKRVIEHELIGLHQVCDRVPSCTVQATSGLKHTGSDALLVEPCGPGRSPLRLVDYGITPPGVSQVVCCYSKRIQ